MRPAQDRRSDHDAEHDLDDDGRHPNPGHQPEGERGDERDGEDDGKAGERQIGHGNDLLAALTVSVTRRSLRCCDVAVDFTDDEVLVPALRKGDEDAFGWLVDRYHSALRRLALGYVSTGAVADEVVQETWLAVITGIDRFEGRSSLKTWIYRILMNKARTRGVREHRSVPFSSFEDDSVTSGFPPDRFRTADDPSWPGHWSAPPRSWQEQPHERLQARETLTAVRDAIALLPPNQRQVISLRDIDGWSSEEVCNVLSLSQTNQRVLLHRARAKVRLSLEAVLDTDTP